MDLPITERGELIRKTGRIGDLPLALVNKIWRITGTRRARARWNRLRDYFKLGNLFKYWFEQLTMNERVVHSRVYRDQPAYFRKLRFIDFQDAVWREISGGARDPNSSFYEDPNNPEDNWEYSEPTYGPSVINLPWSWQRHRGGGLPPLPGHERRDFSPALLRFLTPGLGLRRLYT